MNRLLSIIAQDGNPARRFAFVTNSALVGMQARRTLGRSDLAITRTVEEAEQFLFG